MKNKRQTVVIKKSYLHIKVVRGQEPRLSKYLTVNCKKKNYLISISKLLLLPLIGISRQAYHAAVQTGAEIEWHCESCAVEWSCISGEPVAASSKLDSLSTSHEPLNPPTIEVSWGSHLEQLVQEQFESSAVGK